MPDAADRKLASLTRQLEALQAARRRRILKWAENHGQAAAAERFGIKRQRVAQLVKKERARLAKEAQGE